MVTQLQDVANTVAQDKISNQRLRNEEIRRQMANPWSEPKEPTTSGRQPLQDVTKGTPTLASTYSGLLSNYQGMTGTSSNSGQTENNYNQKPYTGNPNPLGIPSWGPAVVGTGLSLANAGIAAPLGAAATSLMRGDKAAAVGTLGGLFTNVATKGSVPGLAGVVSSLASGLVGDKSGTEIGQSIANSLIGTGLSAANPLLGLGYQALRFVGVDPARGLQNLFSPNKTVPESWRGTFTSSGYTPPAGSWMSSGNENYSPYGGSQYNRVGDSSSSSSSSYSSSGYPDTGANSGFDSSTWGGSGGSSGYSGSDSSSSYSNPAYGL